MLVVERRVEDDLLGRHGGDVAGRNGSHCCLLGVVGWVVVEHLRRKFEWDGSCMSLEKLVTTLRKTRLL